MPGLNNFIGQTALKSLIQAKIEFARTQNITLPHLLISGAEEQGKTTFAASIAEELGVSFCSLSAEGLVKQLDLTGVLTNVGQRHIVEIGDLELLRPPVLDVLIEAISEFKLRILIGGKNPFTHSIELPRFTLIGTTSKPWLVEERIRRWCTACSFGPYTSEEIIEIARLIAWKKNILLDMDAASDLAQQCRRPGEAEVLLQKIASYLPRGGVKRIDREAFRKISEFLGAGNLYPEILNVAERLRTMDGIEFEHWVADLFRMSGFQVKVTQASGDHGVDLWASSDGRVVAVQCKRWDGTVGEPVLRDLYGTMMSANAYSGCLITTGSFTAQAYQFSQGKPLHLIGFDTLMEAVKSPMSLRQLLNFR